MYGAKLFLLGVLILLPSPSNARLTASPRAPEHIVKLCSDALFTAQDIDSNTGESVEEPHSGALAVTELQKWLATPEHARALTAELSYCKRYSDRYISIAYVLGYNGIDVLENMHRLRLAALYGPDGDMAAIKVFDIYERHPSISVLREALAVQSDGAYQMEYDEVFGGFFIQHANKVLSAVYGYPKLEDDVASDLDDLREMKTTQ